MYTLIMTPNEAIGQAKAIVIAMKIGTITYNEAKAKCKPLFDIANKRIAEIAKKNNKPAYKISFASFAR